MKFNIGEKIKVKATGRTGEIKGYRQEAYYINGKIEETIKYYLHFPPYSNEWFKEDQLSNTYTFDNKFELELINLLTDVYLKHRQFNIISSLSKEKQQYLG